jgi:alpha-tubulin suppressor-like RCC1 family protein
LAENDEGEGSDMEQGKGFSLGKIDWVLEAVKELAPEGLVGIKAIAAGCFHSLALTEEGDVYPRGENPCGELRVGDAKDRLTPTKVGSCKLSLSR